MGDMVPDPRAFVERRASLGRPPCAAAYLSTFRRASFSLLLKSYGFNHHTKNDIQVPQSIERRSSHYISYGMEIDLQVTHEYIYIADEGLQPIMDHNEEKTKQKTTTK